MAYIKRIEYVEFLETYGRDAGKVEEYLRVKGADKGIIHSLAEGVGRGEGVIPFKVDAIYSFARDLENPKMYGLNAEMCGILGDWQIVALTFMRKSPPSFSLSLSHVKRK